MLLNILPHFLLQNFFSYFPPLKPRCILWSEKYSNHCSFSCGSKLALQVKFENKQDMKELWKYVNDVKNSGLGWKPGWCEEKREWDFYSLYIFLLFLGLASVSPHLKLFTRWVRIIHTCWMAFSKNLQIVTDNKEHSKGSQTQSYKSL